MFSIVRMDLKLHPESSPMATSNEPCSIQQNVYYYFTGIGYHNIKVFSTLRVGCSYHAPLVERS